MKTVKWLSSERIIPNCGVAIPGQEITLPDVVADCFIAQGEAVKIEEPVHPHTRKTTKEIES